MKIIKKIKLTKIDIATLVIGIAIGALVKRSLEIFMI